ncbi:Alpha/Beta hydrolase protein [Aspergillus navahoensis]
MDGRALHAHGAVAPVRGSAWADANDQQHSSLGVDVQSHPSKHRPEPPSAPTGGATSKSPRTNLFLFFAVTGVSLQYRNLAQSLRSYNIIGVDHMHMNNPRSYPFIAAIGADYAALLRRHQPQGPYMLGGFSFGGLVAWTVATHLEAQGETVRLVLTDSEALTLYERPFDIPTKEIADPVTLPELAEFRSTLLAQTKHNLAIHDGFHLGRLRGPALLIRRCTEPVSVSALGDEVSPDDPHHVGACQGANGFEDFAAGNLVRCVPSSDRYTMLKEES